MDSEPRREIVGRQRTCAFGYERSQGPASMSIPAVSAHSYDAWITPARPESQVARAHDALRAGYPQR